MQPLSFLGVSARSYDQTCGLAAALDVLGERWTLLVLRELALGPKRFRDLTARLPGAGTNLLSARLRSLEAAGVIRRGDGRAYELDERGEALRPVLEGLATWGLPLVVDPAESGAAARASWAAGTMGAHARAHPDPDLRVLAAFTVGDERLWVRVEGGDVVVREGAPPWPPDLAVEADVRTFLLVARGDLGPDALTLVSGDPALLRRLLAVWRLPVPAAA
jgi:DNA-binding HxlR family transcriptional regulator